MPTLNTEPLRTIDTKSSTGLGSIKEQELVGKGWFSEPVLKTQVEATLSAHFG